MDSIYQKFIKEFLAYPEQSAENFLLCQREFARKNKVPFLHKDKLLRAYQNLLAKGMVATNHELLKILQTKNVRSHSGIVVVSVLTKPFPCPGQCIFCPTEEGIPKSYLAKEPAVMRALANNYDPYLQVSSRLTALRDTGHKINKVSIRIIGGTWSSYDRSYRTWFIRRLFQACNDFGQPRKSQGSLLELQQINEKAISRLVELSVETRQDCVSAQELEYFRYLGITKVELGVQTLDDGIAALNNRTTTNRDTIFATELLKDYGFKVSYQMMLNLYGSNPETDLKIFQKMFKDEHFRPDHLKVYPLALLKNTDLYKYYLSKKFTPFDQNTLVKLICDIKAFVPEYCRIERVIRDIPASDIVEGGASISNLRQQVENKMRQNNKSCHCIRCREIKSDKISGNLKIKVLEYFASGETEYFLSVVQEQDDRLLGFCRLRLVGAKAPQTLSNCAIIREIHVYGPVLEIGERNKSAVQHQGWGKKLVAEAEKIAKQNHKQKIAVIAGVGVRGYFRSLGYALNNTYMVKELS